MDGVTAVIVSYKQDLEKFRQCLDSVITHGHQLHEILVIVNDNPDVVPLFKQVVNGDPRIQVLHWSDIAEWTGPLDWWSQQYFKLAVSGRVRTPWYLLIDSDDFIFQDLNNDTLFESGKARCLTEPRECIDQSNNPDLSNWLRCAYAVFNNVVLSDWTMGNLTPFMMNTTVARCVFHSVLPEFFNPRLADFLTLEFYLYYAYLDQKNLFKHLYSPVNYLGYAIDKRH